MSNLFLALNYLMLFSVCDFKMIFYTFPSSQFEFVSTYWLHDSYYVSLNFYYFVILSDTQYSLGLDLILILRLARFIILRKIFFAGSSVQIKSKVLYIVDWTQVGDTVTEKLRGVTFHFIVWSSVASVQIKSIIQ